MKSKTFMLVIAVALVSVGITYSFMSKRAGAVVAESPAAEEGEKKGMDISGLKIEPAIAGEGWESVSATGKVVVPPDGMVKITPRIEGKVVAAHGTVGDSVSKGQVVAVISSVELAEARAQYRQALAKQKAAQKNLDQERRVANLGANSVRPYEEARTERLSAQGDVADAKSEVAQAKSELVQAQSEAAQCKARLERARELYADKIVSKADLETAENEYKRDSAEVDAAQSKVSRTQSQVEKAQAKLEIANQYLSREEKVYKGKVVDSRAIQSAQAELTTANIDVQAAADRIRVLGADPNGAGDTISVVSPISGQIVSRSTNVGEMASPSNALFTVANLSRVWVEADVYEKDLARVKRGQAVEIGLDTYPDRVFSGKVESIGDVLSSESRTAKVLCLMTNPQGLVRGEMFARVSIITAKHGTTVLIPKQAVLDDAGKKIIFTPCMECPEDIKAGTNACGAYDQIEVTTGAVRGSNIEVLSGVKPGLPIVTTGAYQIKSALSSGKLEAGCTDH